MSRRHRKLANLVVVAAGGAALSLSLSGTLRQLARADEPAGGESDAPSELPEHLKALQQHLGGSVVEQFDSLRPDPVAAPAWWRQFRGSLDAHGVTGRPAHSGSLGTPTWGATWSGTMNATISPEVVPAAAQAPVAVQAYAPSTSGVAPQAPTAVDPSHAVTALREVAARLDLAANRLERLELYSQADTLREHARELRQDARRRSATAAGIVPAPSPYPSAPPSAPIVPVTPQFTPAAPPSSDPPSTSSGGTWHLQWVGPTPPVLNATGPTTEPADAPVWSEDQGSSDPPRATRGRRRDPATVPR
jgi:hypothetical protein